MRGNSIRPGGAGELSRPHRIGQRPAARVPHGGHMVDIHAERSGGTMRVIGSPFTP